MKGITHSLGGVAVGIATVNVAGIDITTSKGIGSGAAIIGMATLGSLLPDIDAWNSTISRRARIISIPVKVLQILTKIFHIEGFEHRGIMHTLLFPIIFGIAGCCTGGGRLLFIALALGYLSHLLLDGFTPTGIPLMAPVLKIRVRFLPRILCIKTGSLLELPVIIALGILIYHLGKLTFQVVI